MLVSISHRDWFQVSCWSSLPCLLIRCVCVDGKLITVVIGIFVDDLLVTGNSLDAIEQVKTLMGERFEFTDQGCLEHYLGNEVSRVDELQVYSIASPVGLRQEAAGKFKDERQQAYEHSSTSQSGFESLRFS